MKLLHYIAIFILASLIGSLWIARPSIASTRVTPTTWKALFLVYGKTDVTYSWQGKNYHMVGSMSGQDLNNTRTMLLKIPSTVSQWSGGYAAMSQTIVYPSRTITSVSSLGGGGFWVSPTDVKAELDKYAPTGKFDSIFVVWRNDDGNGLTVPFNTGLSVGPSSWSNGAGYSQVDDPDNDAAWGGYYPQELFIHEWTHQTTDFYLHKGYPMPNIDDMASYGYSPDPITHSWKLALSDIMQGKVKDPNTGSLIGITAAAWKRGTPIKSN